MSVLMPPAELEDLEIQLLLEGVYLYYGFDFRNYTIASIKQRIESLIQTDQLSSISHLQEKILHEPVYLERFLQNLFVHSPEMFGDPIFFHTFKAQVVPVLRTYPFIRIWHAGCSTGEDVYAIAMMLWEAGIYPRCRIYATDFNESLVLKAKAGIFSLKHIQNYAALYQQAGGEQQFSDYYSVSYENAVIHPCLKENIVFATYNLVTDASFNEFNLILCRDILSNFNPQLQTRVHQLFHHSLSRFGILGLGKQETLKFSPYRQCYEPLEAQAHFYHRVA
ncbi:MAG: CheR family methyltransferase [Leptolyngbyaceae cyanobacterium bins.302]|nr:CheR family methyltransferase [Leptolyngbyaceae cyanobacterium bins.302]